MKKVLVAGVLVVGAIIGYQQLNSEKEGAGESSSASSRWQSAKTSVKSSDSHKGDQATASGKDKKEASVQKGNGEGSKTPVENPFFKRTPDTPAPTWEEAKAFAFREIDFTPKNEQEAALLEMNRYMAASFLVPDSHKNLLNYYKEKGLRPDLSQDSNPYTGKMMTIRTENSLPGTRYAHSQFFANKNEALTMQHTSIEFRPGPQAFERVNEMVQKLYQVKDGTLSKNGRFMNYKLGNGQILWVHQLGAEDLKDNPINAYEESDIGTIRMAIEEEIHFEEDGVDPHMAPGEQGEGESHQH